MTIPKVFMGKIGVEVAKNYPFIAFLMWMVLICALIKDEILLLQWWEILLIIFAIVGLLWGAVMLFKVKQKVKKEGGDIHEVSYKNAADSAVDMLLYAEKDLDKSIYVRGHHRLVPIYILVDVVCIACIGYRLYSIFFS